MFKKIFFALLAISAIKIAVADTCLSNQMTLSDGSCVDAKFSITTTNDMPNNATFAFYLSAQGTFYVDWGEGNNTPAEIITHDNTTETLYSHTYTTGGEKTIRFGGVATKYKSGYNNTIRFGYGATADDSTPQFISAINGSLGEMFPTLDTTYNNIPAFSSTFSRTKIATVPETLFSGIHDSTPYMFQSTFSYSSISTIPANLFRDITEPAPGLFNSTFMMTTSLHTIPSTLFHNVHGSAAAMFQNTFRQSGLTSIPPELFQTITGSANNLFDATFLGCRITLIPDNLFPGITNVGIRQFGNTFSGNSLLTGYIPPSLFSGLNNSGLDTTNLMQNIFNSCPNLATTCPPGTVQFITGYEDYWAGHVSCVDENMVCNAGQYLPAHGYECAMCPQNNYCPGGTYQYSDNQTSGLMQCPNSLQSPIGMSSVTQCGHVLHLGNDAVYLHSTKKTQHALHIDMDGDGTADFFGNMTTTETPMSYGTNRKLKVWLNNTTYFIYDDSAELNE